jgi:hypothetical protein
MNLMECHSPYMPPSPFNGLGPLARIKATRDGKRYLNMEAVWRANLARQLPPPNVLARMRQLYAHAVRYMDQWFDERGRWVKGTFTAFDGSTIEYILQE